MPIDRSIANPFVAGGDVPQIMNYLNQQKQQQVENALRSKQQEMQDRAFAADDERNRFMDKRLVQADQAAIQQQEAAQAKLKQEEYSQFVTNGAQLLKRVADTQPQVFDTVKQRMAEELRTRFSDMPQPNINNVTPQSVQEFLAQVSASTGAGVDATLSPQEQFAQSQQAQLENLKYRNNINEASYKDRLAQAASTRTEPHIKILTAEEAAAEGLPPGQTYKKNTKTNDIVPVSGTSTDAGKAGVPTESERTSANYFGRMEAAEKLLTDYTPNVKDFYLASKVMSGSPGTALAATNFLSKEGQKYYQAAADWVRAKLRKESGAVIGPQEMEQEIRTYFPIPGEDPDTSEQKRLARIQAMNGMREMGGRAIESARQQGGGTVRFEDLPE